MPATTPVTTRAALVTTQAPVAVVTTTSTPAAAIYTTPETATTTPAAAVATTSPKTTAQAATTQSSTSSGTAGLALAAGSVSNALANFANPSTPFPDGTIPCSSFPSSQQGVIALDYLGLGGWTGIQSGNAAGSSCTPGSLCSYACQPGMSKTQWPSSQPADGQSRGGLTCGSDNMLHLSDTSKPYLCEWGQNSAYIVSSLSSGVAVCRTDYPGSENMNVPTWVAPGASAPLSVVNEDTYYQWQGKRTSSQYYINNAGVSQQDGCLWGTPGSNVGNFSPMNLGAGYTDGISWLSIFPNPQTTTKLNFNIRIVKASGSMNGECYYENGQYGGASATSNGCTVACQGVCNFQFY